MFEGVFPDTNFKLMKQVGNKQGKKIKPEAL
jgi:hypothetical protein